MSPRRHRVGCLMKGLTTSNLIQVDELPEKAKSSHVGGKLERHGNIQLSFLAVASRPIPTPTHLALSSAPRRGGHQEHAIRTPSG